VLVGPAFYRLRRAAASLGNEASRTGRPD